MSFISSNNSSEVQTYEKLNKRLHSDNNIGDFLELCSHVGTFYENVTNYQKGAIKLVAVCHEKLTDFESRGFRSEDTSNMKDRLAQSMYDYIGNHI